MRLRERPEDNLRDSKTHYCISRQTVSLANRATHPRVTSTWRMRRLISSLLYSAATSAQTTQMGHGMNSPNPNETALTSTVTRNIYRRARYRAQRWRLIWQRSCRGDRLSRITQYRDCFIDSSIHELADGPGWTVESISRRTPSGLDRRPIHS